MQPNPTIKEISNLGTQLSEADQAALLKTQAPRWPTTYPLN